jgi:hypothetical protein
MDDQEKKQRIVHHPNPRGRKRKQPHQQHTVLLSTQMAKRPRIQPTYATAAASANVDSLVEATRSSALQSTVIGAITQEEQQQHQDQEQDQEQGNKEWTRWIQHPVIRDWIPIFLKTSHSKQLVLHDAATWLLPAIQSQTQQMMMMMMMMPPDRLHNPTFLFTHMQNIFHTVHVNLTDASIEAHVHCAFHCLANQFTKKNTTKCYITHLQREVACTRLDPISKRITDGRIDTELHVYDPIHQSTTVFWIEFKHVPISTCILADVYKHIMPLQTQRIDKNVFKPLQDIRTKNNTTIRHIMQDGTNQLLAICQQQQQQRQNQHTRILAISIGNIIRFFQYKQNPTTTSNHTNNDTLQPAAFTDTTFESL